MNITNKIIAALVGAVIVLNFSSCSESFLDTEPAANVSSEQLSDLKDMNPDLIKGSVFGMYANMFTGATGGTSDHDDFGQKSIDMTTDMMTGDMACSTSNYGWFEYAHALTGHTRTGRGTPKFWRYYYRLIKSANDVMDALGDESTLTGSDLKAYYAQAKTIRAFAYYSMLQVYAGNYDEWKSKPVLPYYKTQKTEATVGLSTTEDIMKWCIADLSAAVDTMSTIEYERTFKHEVDVAVGLSLLAYAQLYVGDYTSAAAASAIVADVYPVMSSSEIIESGFRSLDIPAWIWGVDITVDNTGGLMGFWGHMDYFTYSYCAAGDMKTVSDAFYPTISDTDMRKNWFHPTVLVNWYKFYAKERVAMGDRQWLNDVCFLRTEELLLINAEANARLGNLDIAKASLKKLLDERDSSAAAALAGMGQDDLLDTIFFNWRLEMWGEGRALSTFKRFKKSTTWGSSHYAHAGETFNYNDEKWVYQIPEVELVNNPNLQ